MLFASLRFRLVHFVCYLSWFERRLTTSAPEQDQAFERPARSCWCWLRQIHLLQQARGLPLSKHDCLSRTSLPWRGFCSSRTRLCSVRTRSVRCTSASKGKRWRCSTFLRISWCWLIETKILAYYVFILFYNIVLMCFIWYIFKHSSTYWLAQVLCASVHMFNFLNNVDNEISWVYMIDWW